MFSDISRLLSAESFYVNIFLRFYQALGIEADLVLPLSQEQEPHQNIQVLKWSLAPKTRVLFFNAFNKITKRFSTYFFVILVFFLKNAIIQR